MFTFGRYTPKKLANLMDVTSIFSSSSSFYLSLHRFFVAQNLTFPIHWVSIKKYGLF